AGSKFNGVLCGRATWSGVVEPFAKEGEEAAREWLRTEGKKNITDLNKVIERTATSWHGIVEVNYLKVIVHNEEELSIDARLLFNLFTAKTWCVLFYLLYYSQLKFALTHME